MKKKVVTIIFSVLAVVALAMVLIFIPKRRNNNEISDEESSRISLNVYLPSKITMDLGTKAKIDSDAVVVVPNSKEKDLKVEVSVLESGVQDGISLVNNIITANNVGNYQIKYSLKKDEITTLQKVVNVSVKKDISTQRVKQVVASTNISSTLSLKDAFIGYETFTYSIENDYHVDINNGIITPLQQGNSLINFIISDTSSINSSNVKYIYSFELIIKPKPQYIINILNLDNNQIEINLSESDKKVFAYEVVDLNENLTSQIIIIESKNEDIATVECPTDGILRVVGHNLGETTILLKSVLDENATAELKVIVN